MNRLLLILYIVLTYSLLIVGFYHPISEMTQDLGRHILTGEIILKTFSVPGINLFSYTNPSFPFLNHHWLSEIVFYLTFVFFSFPGLFALKLLLILTSFSLIFIYAIRRGERIVVILASILYLRILFERTHIRPELFSFLFIALFIVVLYKFREKSTRFILTLVLIQFVWVNSHIYFIIGISIAALFLLDEISRNYIKLSQKKYEILSPRIITLGLFLCGLLLSSLANPHFFSGLVYPFHVFDNYGYSIEENQNIFFLWEYSQKATIAFFALSSTLLFVFLLITGKKARLIDWLLAICFTLLAILHIRNFPLFVFATFIPFVHAATITYQKFNVKKLFSHSLVLNGLAALFLMCLLVWQIVVVSNEKRFGYSVLPGAQKGADFFIKQKLQGPIFNNFDIGSYLEYRLYPKELVFIDGRPEAYPASFFSKVYIPLQENSYEFERFSKQYNFNTIFFSHTDQTPWAGTFLKTITKNKQWKMVYLDPTVVIFLKNTKENKSVIDTHTITENIYTFPPNISNNASSIIHLARFFLIIQWPIKTQEAFTHLLASDPQSCIALSQLALSPRTSDTMKNIYSAQYNQTCR